ncbi:tetratricopeptide repeat protein, partial [bacterium]|nr:tetratricopeptide repeat protein [bacterium]
MNKTTEEKKLDKKIDKYRKSGNIQEAIETCKSAISQDENNARLHIKLGDLYMEWHLDIHQVQQYADEAITEYQRALESNINSSEIYFKIAMAFYYKRELDKALNYFKLALEHDTKFSEAYFMIAQIFTIKGDLQEALEYAQKTISLAPFKSARAYYLVYSIQSLSNRVKWYQKFPNLLASFLTVPFDKYGLVQISRHIS